MADDIQSNIRINVDTASAMDSIRLLQNQISAFHTQMAKMGAASVADSRNMQQNLINSINSTGAFTANMTKVRTTAEQFSYSLEKNKLTMGEYFRYAGGATKSFGKLFKTEFETINKVARERVKDLQTQYIKLGRDANGAMQAIKVRPLTLDMENLGTKTQIAAQRQQLLNQLLKQGSTNLLNFGKNTQWAGRQLMVGFTVPLSIMGSAAMRAYKDIEEASIRLKRVYGDLGTTNMETEKMVKQVQMLAQEYTKYGIAVKDSMEMAATAAATGKKGADLLAQVSSSARLAVLGGVEQQMALKTTISLTDAFGVSTKQLSKDINFLNAVENQTVLSIEDMTVAIPKAAPVIQQLGGDVKDLAFFLTAMKEGGINASESANALKSGLASLINPTNTASKMLQGFGINLRGIVQGNKGDVKQTVIDFAQALDKLDPLNRAKAIEQLFGKFQFARMSTLFKNVIEQGSQASEVLKLASQSSLELSMLAQKELNKIEQSPLYKFQKAIADFQAQLAPVGEQFMKALTPIINFGTDVLKNFNNLGDGVKGFIVKFVAIAGVVGPVLLMSFGLIANAVANVIKGFALMKDIFNKTGKSSLSLGEQVNYMTQEQIQAAAIASSLDQVHSKLKQTFTSEAAAVDMLTAAYQRSVTAQQAFAVPITTRGPVKKLATGGFVSGPGTGTSDSIPAMLSNGEAVIPAKSVSQNRDLVQSLINNSLPRFATGGIIGDPSKSLMQQVNGTSAVIAYGAHQPFTSAHQGIAQRGMSMAEESGIPFFQFTSNQGKAKRSVLGDDLKSRMISEAIGRNPEFAKNPFELMAILSKAGIKDVNILLGEDRMKSPVWEAAAKEFGITITKTGIPRPVGSTSGTMARAAAASGNVGMFESLLASGMSKSTKNEIFKSLFAAGTAKVRKFSNGGMVSGPGSGTSDSILARVSNGEAIIPARSVARNPGMIRQLISGNIPGFNQGFIDEISGRGRNTSTQANISAILSSEIGKIRSRSEMYGYDADRVVEGFIAHIRNSSENIDKLTQANIKAMVRNNPERITYSPNSGQQQTTQFAHVGGNATMTAQEALANLTLSPSKRANLEMVARENSSQPVNVYHGFGFQAKGSVNEQMAKAGADLSEMVDDFGSRGVDKWRDAVKNGGGNFEQLISQATAYDEQVLLRLQQSKAQGVTKIVDTQLQIDNLRQQALAAGKTFDSKQYVIMEQIHDSVITDLKMMGTDLDNVFNSARQTIKDVRYRIPASMHNVPGIFEGTGRGPEKPNVRVMGGNYGTMPTASQATAAGRANGVAFVNAQNAVLDNPANDPAMVSRDSRRRNSPHEQASIDGRDDGIAYNKARSAEVQKASQSGRVAGQGGNRVSSEGNMIFLPGQGYVSEGQLARDQALANAPMIGPKEGTRLQKFKSGFNADSIYRRIQGADQDKLAGGIRNKAFGASGAMALGSMVLPGEAGQAMGIASMLTSFGGMGAGGIAKGLKSLSPNLIGLGLKFTKLIPYVGIAVTAFEAFDTFVMPMIKKNSKAYEAVANTLSITQEKLDKINGFFGTELKLTGVRAATIASGDQTKGEATIAQQFQQSQEFKDLYEEDAKEMAKLTSRQFKRAMEAMAMDLSGQGLEPEGVTAIVDAIAISAGKTRVSVSPELFSIANPEAKMLMQKNLKSAFSQISEGSKGINPAGTLDPTGRTLQAAKGDFDNYYLTPVDPESVAKIKAGTAEIASYISALSGQFENGQISVKEFQVEYAKLISISKQQPGTQGIETLRAAMISLNSEIGNALNGLNDVQFLVWKEAVDAGVVLTKEALNAAVYATKEVKQAYTDAVKEATKEQYVNRAKEQKLKKQIANIENSSVDIAKTEQKINDKYDKRIEQLEKIKKLNDQLAKSQQGQLTLAEALNKGDIAAAARAAIDVQNNDIQASLDNQKDGLDAARKAEIAPLKDAQESNTAALKSLAAQIDKLNTDGVVIKNPEGETNPALKSAMGNDPMGWLGLLGNAALDVSAVGLVKNLITLFTNPGNFFKEKTQQYLPPGTAVTQDGRLVYQRPETKPPGSANGGHIRGPGTGTSDDIPAMLSNGEYVIRANAVKTIGVDTLDKLNQADRLGFAAGGIVNVFRKPKPPRKDQEPNVDPMDPKSVAAYRQRISKLFKPTPRKEDPTWFDWTGGKQSILDDTGNYPGYYQWTAPSAVGGSFGKKKTGPSAYTWADSPFQRYNPLNSMTTNKKLFEQGAMPEAFPNPAANQNPLDIIEAYKKMLEGRKRLAENVYLPDLNKDTTLMTSKNPILYTLATYAKAFSNRGIYTDSTGGQDLEKARALIQLGKTSKMIPGWDGLDPKEFKNLVDAMHSEFGPQATKGMIGKLGFGKRYDRLQNPPKGPSAKLNYAENYLGISGSIPKDSPIYQYAYNYMTNDYEGGKRGRLDWFRGTPNSFMLNPKLGTYNRLGGYNGFADGGFVGPRPAPQWDDKGRWVVSRGESYWSTAEKTMPGGMSIGPWWSRILKSNIDPETGKERRLYRNSRIWIPGSKQPYPPKSGEPFISKVKKPTPNYGIFGRLGTGENHLGFMGVGGFGMMKQYANGGLVGYKDGGKAKKSKGYPAAFNVTSGVGQQRAERNRLYKQGGFQGFEAGANSFGVDLMNGPLGGFFKTMGEVVENDPILDSLLSTLSLPVNLIGGAVRGSLNAGRALVKGDLLGAATAGFRGVGDAFASTYGHIFDKENAYKSQFELAAQEIVERGEFGSKDNKELQALARIIGGTGNLAFDPLNYVGVGLAAKAAGVGKLAKPLKKTAQNLSTYVAAKKFGLQTKNVPPLINPGKGTRPSLEAAEKAISKMNLGKNIALDVRTGITDFDMAEMFDAELHQIPDEMFGGLQGSFRDTKATGLKGMAGSISGTIFNNNGVLSAQDIFIELGKEYRGKGIAQKFTTQYMELLKNMGVKNIKIDAALSDGGYAWAKAGFKFDGRPNGLIERMKMLEEVIPDKQFQELLERLKTADAEDLPLPKEILGLKTDWRKYFSEEQLIDAVEEMNTGYVYGMNEQVNLGTKTLGELIMRGSKWQGVKELGGNSIIRKTIQDVAGSLSTKAKVLGSKMSSIFKKKSSPRFVPSKETLRQALDEAMKNPGLLTNRNPNSVMNILRGETSRSKYDMETFTRPLQEASDPMRREIEDKYFFGEGETSYGYLTNKNFLRRPLVRGRSLEDRTRTNFLNPFTDSSNQYGSVALLLKDKILKNATATRDDSFRVYDEDFGLKTDKFPFNNIFRENEFYSPYTNYIEAQFGKYSRGDIAAIYVQTQKNLKEIKAVVKEMKLKIPVKLYNEKPVMEEFLDSIKNAKRNRLAAKFEQDAIDSFANGGMVRGYAAGGFVMPSPEPAPTQYAMGGMVRAANGGMLLNGKMYGGFANGGMVLQKFAEGGYSMGTDTVPAMLTPGEFVIKKSAVDRIGASTLAKINGYANGGLVGGSSAVSGDSVYNNNTYEVNVNVSSNSNPDQIANAVMNKIRQIDNGRVRGLGR